MVPIHHSTPPDLTLPHAARTAEVVVAPSVSTMILRASSYIPPDVSERNLIACGLQKGIDIFFELLPTLPTGPEVFVAGL
jgi:hypothetical protein